MSTSIDKSEVAAIAMEAAHGLLTLHSKASLKEDPIFIDQVVFLTGYRRATIYSFIHKKEIPYHKTAGKRKVFFYRSEIVRWMENKEVLL